MKLAKSLNRLGTETAFSVLAEAKKLESCRKANFVLDYDLILNSSTCCETDKKALDDGHHGYVLSNGILECDKL